MIIIKEMAKEFKVKSLYDPGTAKFLEDKYVIRPPFYGVLDGVSGLYDPNIGPRFFGKLSGGLAVVKIVEKVFQKAKVSESLDKVLRHASAEIRKFVKQHRLNLKAGQVPGADFAFCKIGKKQIEIVQAAAAMVIVLLKNGKILN